MDSILDATFTKTTFLKKLWTLDDKTLAPKCGSLTERLLWTLFNQTISAILDVSTQDGIDAFRTAYLSLKASGLKLKQNRKSAPEDTDVIVRALDRQVFKYLHQIYEDQGLPPPDAVRGAFPQGEAVAPTSASPAFLRAGARS